MVGRLRTRKASVKKLPLIKRGASMLVGGAAIVLGGCGPMEGEVEEAATSNVQQPMGKKKSRAAGAPTPAAVMVPDPLRGIIAGAAGAIAEAPEREIFLRIRKHKDFINVPAADLLELFSLTFGEVSEPEAREAQEKAITWFNALIRRFQIVGQPATRFRFILSTLRNRSLSAEAGEAYRRAFTKVIDDARVADRGILDAVLPPPPAKGRAVRARSFHELTPQPEWRGYVDDFRKAYCESPMIDRPTGAPPAVASDGAAAADATLAVVAAAGAPPAVASDGAAAADATVAVVAAAGAAQADEPPMVDLFQKEQAFAIPFALATLWHQATEQLSIDRRAIGGVLGMVNDDLSINQLNIGAYLGQEPRLPFLEFLHTSIYKDPLRAFVQSIPKSRERTTQPMRGDLDAASKFATIDNDNRRLIFVSTKNGVGDPVVASREVTAEKSIVSVRLTFDFQNLTAEERYFVLKWVPDGIANISARGFLLEVDVGDADRGPRMTSLILTKKDGYGRYHGFNMACEGDGNGETEGAFSMLSTAVRNVLDTQRTQGTGYGWSNDTRVSIFLPMESDEETILQTISILRGMAAVGSVGASETGEPDEAVQVYTVIYKVIGQMLAAIDQPEAPRSPKPARHLAAQAKKGKAGARKQAAETKVSETTASSVEAGAATGSPSAFEQRAAAPARVEGGADAPAATGAAEVQVEPAAVQVREEDFDEVYDLEPWRKFAKRQGDARGAAAAAAAEAPTIDEEAALLMAQLDLPKHGTRMKAPQILAAKNRLNRIFKVRQIAQGKSAEVNPDITVNRNGSHITWHVPGAKPFTTVELHGRGDAELPTQIVKTLLLEMARFLLQSEAKAPEVGPPKN